MDYFTVHTPRVKPQGEAKAKRVNIPKGMTPLEAMKADAAAIRRRTAPMHYEGNKRAGMTAAVQARRDIILAYVKMAGPVRMGQIAEATKIDLSPLRNDVSWMVTQGILERHGNGNRTVYGVGEE